MAPPTMAPPMIPPATAAPKPRCAFAGVAASEAAIVATAAKAAIVFLMSWLSSRWAPGSCAGLHAVFETRRLDKKAYNCQSKVNASVILAEKTYF
jgi:hypothetical protein